MPLPSWLEFVVLALAAFRVVRLVGWDDFPPIVRARAWMTGETQLQGADGPIVRWRRPLVSELISCAYCSGFWVSSVFYVFWIEWPKGTLYVAVPLAISSTVGVVARMLDP